MATLSADSPQVLVTGDMNAIGIIANDIVYEGSMVGDNGAGYGRPLVAGDKFLGHNIFEVDNAVPAGAAGAKNLRLRTGVYRLVCDLVGLITDVGQPVYASDDQVLTFAASIATVKNSYVGRISRYVSATKMEVEFVTCGQDEFDPNPNRLTKSAAHTTVAVDNGKIIYVDTTALISFLAAVPGYKITIVNGAGLGVAETTIDFNAAETSLGGCGLATAGVLLTNTKATAQRGDFLQFIGNTAAWNIVNKRGTWVSST